MKVAVKQLIMERFDKSVANRDGIGPSSGTPPSDGAGSNGHIDRPNDSQSVSLSPPHSSSPRKRLVDSEDLPEDSSRIPNKKRKSDNDVDSDALLAAKLQAEENMRARPTRRGASSRSQPNRRKAKTKTASKVKAEDDSYPESGEEGTKKEKEVNRSGGFHVSPS